MRRLEIVHFTDPACPWAFSAEPQRRRLRWLYGEGLRWRHRMVVLSQTPEEYLERGFTPERQSAALRRIQRAYGMPIDPCERPRMLATVVPCRAVVAARLHAPAAEEPLLRSLRVRAMAGELIDEPAVIAAAAGDAGLDPELLAAWSREPQAEEALAEDMEAARAPARAALALDHKLAGEEDERRYSCPSYELARDEGEPLVVPGFQPPESYEVAVANAAPWLERRPPPERVEEVLAWADAPLATAEVAALLGVEAPEARERLARVARMRPVGADGYWTLREAAASAA